MKRKTRAGELAEELRRGQERFEAWRRSRVHRRIPEELWLEAVRLARVHGAHQTARALRLDGHALRQRMQGLAVTAPKGASGFIDVTPLSVPSAPECVVVVEGRDGARMRIELRSVAGVDLGALARSFAGVA